MIPNEHLDEDLMGFDVRSNMVSISDQILAF